MIVLQLVLFCALFTLMVKLAVRNNALNALYFYPKPVQERVYQLSLTDRETVARKRKCFMIPFPLVMLVALLLILFIILWADSEWKLSVAGWFFFILQIGLTGCSVMLLLSKLKK